MPSRDPSTTLEKLAVMFSTGLVHPAEAQMLLNRLIGRNECIEFAEVGCHTLLSPARFTECLPGIEPDCRGSHEDYEPSRI